MEEPVHITCPWCGEAVHTFFDWSAGSQQYVEDCQVCCRPVRMIYEIDESGSLRIGTERE